MKSFIKSLFFAIASASLLLLAGPQAASGEGGWGTKLNPFAKQAGPPTSARVSDQSGSGWSMPNLWPGNKKAAAKPAARKPAVPSAWQRMTAGSKKMWSKTTDALNPFDDAAAEAEPAATGSNSYFSQVANRKTAAKKPSTFLPSWMQAEEEPKEPATVQEFLGQKRPGF